MAGRSRRIYERFSRRRRLRKPDGGFEDICVTGRTGPADVFNKYARAGFYRPVGIKGFQDDTLQAKKRLRHMLFCFCLTLFQENGRILSK